MKFTRDLSNINCGACWDLSMDSLKQFYRFFNYSGNPKNLKFSGNVIKSQYIVKELLKKAILEIKSIWKKSISLAIINIISNETFFFVGLLFGVFLQDDFNLLKSYFTHLNFSLICIHIIFKQQSYNLIMKKKLKKKTANNNYIILKWMRYGRLIGIWFWKR